MTTSTRSIPDRLRAAGLVMIACSLPWVLMPVALALGASATRGIGVSIGGSSALVVTEAMLPWLTPLSLVTAVAGLLAYFGRGLPVAIAVAIGWIAIGIVTSVAVAIVAGLVAFALMTGSRSTAAALSREESAGPAGRSAP
jgi:hypothetical protein